MFGERDHVREAETIVAVRPAAVAWFRDREADERGKALEERGDKRLEIRLRLGDGSIHDRRLAW
jgi:hypothetical protein